MEYLVLMQHAQRVAGAELPYRDVEGSLYHYPRRYFADVIGFEAFLYYRPARGAPAGQASSYIGYGRLLDWFADLDDAERRFVRIQDYVPFSTPVPFTDPNGAMYEGSYPSRNAFQGNAIRKIPATDFFRILAAAGLKGDPLAKLGSVDALSGFNMLMLNRLPREAPRDRIRQIDRVPGGAGYVPTGKPVDIRESAALQERARADHQLTLRAIQEIALAKGGTTYYNNNIDLLVKLGSERLLIEAKSLNRDSAAVDRMRYGMGQLFDYGVRYRSELEGAKPVLAFGRIPERDTGWLAEILEQNGVGFVGLLRPGDVRPLNEAARQLGLFR
ncbi:MAG: hypothetical protein ABI346_03755 [Candidatus Baltobacteraceae bacterium]